MKQLSIDEKIATTTIMHIKELFLQQMYTDGGANTVIAPDGTKLKIDASSAFAPGKVWLISEVEDPNKMIHICMIPSGEIRAIHQFHTLAPSLNLLWLLDDDDPNTSVTSGQHVYLCDMMLC